MSVAINRSLKAAGDSKGKRGWETLVGYTVAELASHLERQFLPGMTWENRKAWNIDHILPLAMFNFDSAQHPEFRAVWALTNLRPLWDAENKSKSAKRLHLI